MSREPAALRVALVHDYLTQYGGAEKVLEALYRLWPHATVFTTFFDAQGMRSKGFSIPSASIRPLLPARLRLSGYAAKVWTAVYPVVFRRLDLRGFDIVLSSTSYAAHHVRAPAGAVHLAYVHSPPRFLYGYTTEMNHGRLLRLLPVLRALYWWLRRNDRQAVRRVSLLIANSQEVQRRIACAYGREAPIVYPPVQLQRFLRVPTGDQGYFLTWGRLVPSKRVDLLIAAAEQARVPLVIAGEGPDEGRLRAMAGARVTFRGRVSEEALLGLLEGCTAVLFAAEEDFGMVPVEAMAAGKAIIAYGAGGALETVEPGKTGELFVPQTPEALAAVLATFDPSLYTAAACRRAAARFDSAVFAANITALLRDMLAARVVNPP